MKKRVINKNHDKISPIGFGGMRLPQKNGKIDRKLAKEIVYYGIDHGINIIDTAAVYGNGDSEKFFGEILQGKYKDQVKISTKLPVYQINSYEDMEKTLNEQLERLQRDSIDYYLLHNVDLSNMNRLLKEGLLKFLNNYKREGKIKNIGFSYHGKTEEFPLLIDAYNWDVVMVQYNYLDENMQASREGIKYANSKGMGVLIMEPLKGGILSGEMPEEAESIFKTSNPNKSNAEWSLSWLLNQKEITCIFSGMNRPEQVKENIAIGNKVETDSLTIEELETVSKAKEVMQKMLKINCAGCNYCMPCPKKVNIPECFKIYNEKYLFKQEKTIIPPSLISYFTSVGGIMNEAGYAGLCTNCGQCISKCPQHLNIPQELKKVKKDIEGYGFKYKSWFVKKIGMPIYQKLF